MSIYDIIADLITEDPDVIKQGLEDYSLSYLGHVKDAIMDLVDDGLDEVQNLDVYNPVDMQLLAELINLSAKIIDNDYYYYKPYAIAHAISVGAEGGWGDDQAFHLYTKEGGVSSFHGQQMPELKSLKWPHEWSGEHRQHKAYELVKSYLSDKKLFKHMAHKTDPHAEWCDHCDELRRHKILNTTKNKIRRMCTFCKQKSYINKKDYIAPE